MNKERGWWEKNIWYKEENKTGITRIAYSTVHYTEPIHIKRTTVSTTAAAIAQSLEMGKDVCVNGELGREGEDKRDREREKQRKQAMAVELEGHLLS